MFLTTDHLHKTLRTLEGALERIAVEEEGSLGYEIFLSAIVKNFELTLETAGKLLRKALRPHFADSMAVAALTYADVFREAARHGLVDADLVMRWLKYRNSRNRTAHDYGASFAALLLPTMNDVLHDGQLLAAALDRILPAEE